MIQSWENLVTNGQMDRQMDRNDFTGRLSNWSWDDKFADRKATSDVSSGFFWAGRYTHRTHGWRWVEKFPDTWKEHSLALSVFRSLCKTFSKLLKLTLQKTLSWMIFQKKLIYSKNLYSYKLAKAVKPSQKIQQVV